MSAISKQIIATNDDTYADAAGGGNTDRTSNVELVVAGEHPTEPLRFSGGFRFQLVNVPQGAIINSAYLKLTADRNEAGACGCDIFGEAVDDSGEFGTETPDFGGRGKTTAYVSWSLGDWATDTEYTSPDIKSVIQEIVSRPSWSANNALNIFTIDDGSGSHDWRICYPWDEDTSKAAKLVISYNVVFPLTADAIIKKALTGSFTADAYLANAIVANAVIFKAQQSSIIADAILKKTSADTLTADTVLRKTIVGTLDADGVLRKAVSDSIAADGVLFKTISDAIPGDAYLTYGVFADGVLFKTQTGSFSADAIIFPIQHIFMKAGPIYIPVYPLT